MILVLAADFDNLEQELEKFLTITTEYAGTIPVYVATINGEKVLFAECGETKVEIAYTLGVIQTTYEVTQLICIGNCASLRPRQDCLGDVCICKDALQYDVNFCPLGFPQSVIPGQDRSVFCSNPTLIQAARTAALDQGLCVRCGRFVSADRFCCSLSQANGLCNQFNANFLDTESGVIGELADLNDLDAVTVKCSCNYANNCAVSDYQKCRSIANRFALQVAIGMAELLTA